MESGKLKVDGKPERRMFMKLQKEGKYGLLLFFILSIGLGYLYAFYIPIRTKIKAIDQKTILLRTLKSNSESNKNEINFGQTKILSQKQQYESLQNEVRSVLSDADLVLAMKDTIDPYAIKTDVTFLDPVYEDLVDRIKLLIVLKTNYIGLKNMIHQFEKLPLQNSITGLHVNSGYLYSGMINQSKPQSSEVQTDAHLPEKNASFYKGGKPAYDLQVEIEIEFTALHISRKKIDLGLRVEPVPKNNLFE